MIIEGIAMTKMRMRLLAGASGVAFALFAPCGAGQALAQSLPSGAQVRAGQADISIGGADSLVVRQATDRAIIDWTDFSIGAGASVQFDNGAGVTLNRVRGNARSTIDGTLTASGSVWLLNPNGVVVGKDGVVRTGGSFVASTLDVGDDAFMTAAPMVLAGNSTGAIINLGKVGALGGDVVLAARTVRNEGALSAANGTVGMLSGTEISLRDASLDGGRFSVLLGDGSGEITNSGDIRAAMIELRASGGNIYALAGNTGDAISATGIASRDGKVFLIADGGAATVEGVIEAHNADGGGGFIETSGHAIDFSKATIRAADWLIDPEDLTVGSAEASIINSALGGGTNVTLTTTSGSATTDPAGAGAATAGDGDITISAPITWATGAMLTLDAYRSIHVNAKVTIAGGGALSLLTGTGGDYDFGLTGAGFAGRIAYTGAGGSLTINGTPYTLVHSMTELAGISAGGAATNRYTGNFALAESLDAGGTTYTAAVVPYVLTGGVFTGLGNTISNLTIDSASTYVGLFTHVDNDPSTFVHSMLRDLGLVGGSILADGENVGALSGRMTHSDVLHVYSSASVTGRGTARYVGGLVGNAGNVDITESFNTGDVTSESGADTGGLVGWLSLNGSIIRSYATGNVTGTSNVGGLVGWLRNGGNITDAYAWGNVSGTARVGGLVGYMDGTVGTPPVAGEPVTIERAYSTGMVTGTSQIGGLVGYMGTNAGTVTDSYWNTQTSGLESSAGGIGLTTAQLQGPALPTGFGADIWDTVGGMYPALWSLGGGNQQKISGYVTDLAGSPLLSNALVRIYLDGAQVGSDVASASFGADGYYYTTVPVGTVAANDKLGGELILTGSGTDTASAFTYTDRPEIDALGDVVNFDLQAGKRQVFTSGSTLSGAWADLSTAFGSGRLAEFQVALADSALIVEGSNAAGFSIDTPTLLDGTTTVTATDGALSVDATVDGAYALNLIGNGGAVAINADIGAATALSGFTATSADGIVLNGNVKTQSVNGLAGFIYDGYFDDSLAYFDGALVALTGYPQFDSAFTAINPGAVGENLGDLYSMKFQGYFKASETGTYTFSTASDDASYVWIGNAGESLDSLAARRSPSNDLVAVPGIHPVQGDTHTIDLVAGQLYPMLVYFGEADGGDQVTVDFLTPSATEFTSNGAGFYFNTTNLERGRGNVLFNGAVSLSRDVKIVSGGTTTFGSTINGARSLSVDAATNVVAFQGAVGKTTPLGSLLLRSGPMTVDHAIVASGAVQMQSEGDFTIAPGGAITSTATGTAVLLAANGAFVNNGTTSSVAAPNGRWLVYTQDPADRTVKPAGNDFGGLDGKSYYGDTYDFLNRVLAAEPGDGNRFVYRYRPTLTITAGTQTVEYNGSSQVDSYSTAGLEDGDLMADAMSGTLDGLTTSGSAAGDYTLTPTGDGLVSDLNYEFAFESGVLTIDPKILSASLVGTVIKVYDGTRQARLQTGNYLLLGGIVGDDVAIQLPTLATYDNRNAGTGKRVTTSIALIGADKANYRLASDTISADIGVITRKPIDLRFVGPVSKTYDGSRTAELSASNFVLNGVVAGDAVLLSRPRSGTYDSKNAGKGKFVTVTGLALTGTDAANYTIPSTLSSQIGTIDPKVLTAQLVGSVQKVYDGTLNARLTSSNLKVSGMISGDAISVLVNGIAAFDTKDAGTGKTVSAPLALSGADKDNYRLGLSTISAPIGRITPKMLTLAISGSLAVPGGAAGALRLDQTNMLLSGLVTGDSVRVTAVTQNGIRNVVNGAYVTVQVPAGNVQIVGPDARNYMVSGTASGRLKITY